MNIEEENRLVSDDPEYLRLSEQYAKNQELFGKLKKDHPDHPDHPDHDEEYMKSLKVGGTLMKQLHDVTKRIKMTYRITHGNFTEDFKNTLLKNIDLLLEHHALADITLCASEEDLRKRLGSKGQLNLRCVV